jgi:hypothetical protein
MTNLEIAISIAEAYDEAGDGYRGGLRDLILNALDAETARCAGIADSVANRYRERESFLADHDDYVSADIAENRAESAEEVAREIRVPRGNK